MYSTRTVFLILILITLALAVVLSFLLFGQRDDEPRAEQTVEEQGAPPSPEPRAEEPPPVSQSPREELPLGTDANMEFPILEEGY